MSPTKKRVALTIAGSDPSGGAGIQADLKTFHQFGVYGEAAITLITVQNTGGVRRVECLHPELVADQIRAVIEDIPPEAAKTGALGNAGIIEAVAALARDFPFPLVVDPVIMSKHGAPLLEAAALESLRTFLLPNVFLLTPNLEEASALTGAQVHDLAGMRQAAETLVRMGPQAVLVKGGHLRGDATDVLYQHGEWTEFTSPRIETRHTHGTGCTFSAAITASLASGYDLQESVRRAKRYITEAIRNNPGLGSGSGPLEHKAPF
ncbi:MAG: bifunctional hydroxymethylpyrimidine kinase/phosphomethylpyrimidine kinase [Bryobacteraceae bacterium]|jgi:hydroxymethylpyrimidine/phosphomethylpyrimidine kinase